MTRWYTAGAFSMLAGLLMAGSSFAQTYYYHPYYPMGQGYYPGEAGAFGIGPGGRVQYHPSYYAAEPGYGSAPSQSYSPPNITGLPSFPMSESYPAYNGLPGAAGNMAGYPASSEHNPNAAVLDVKVPADARLWVEGQPTHLRGTDRGFVSPALEPGKKYSYDLKAQWTDGKGEKIERTRHIRIQAGSHVTIDFRAASS